MKCNIWLLESQVLLGLPVLECTGGNGTCWLVHN